MGVSSIIKVQFGCWYVILTATTKSKVKDLSVSEVTFRNTHSREHLTTEKMFLLLSCF